MNFIAQVEEHLRDLGAEARKKHPGVKEASERAILQLRTLQNAYVTAVRKATQTGTTHPTTELFRSQDILRPFLLAANYPNASPKLLEISLSAMSLLIEGNAICPGDGIHLIRVWTIQANGCASALRKPAGKQQATSSTNTTTSTTTTTTTSSTSWFGGMLSSSTDVSSSSGQGGNPKKEAEKLALELLSCLIQLLELRDLPVTDEQWASSVALCCILLDVAKSTTVPQAAKSTLHQVLGLLFEKKSKTAIDTWNDLLVLAADDGSTEPRRGAFSHCTGTVQQTKTGPLPPSPKICLELAHILLSQQDSWLTQEAALMDPTFDLTQRQVSLENSSLETLWRSFQLAKVLLQLDSNNDLIASLVQGIVTATETCRKSHDFEDGFVYLEPMETSKNKKTTTLIPDNVLWKAGLALETLYCVLPHLQNPSIVAEAISDFCTICASCQDHMMQLVECVATKDVDEMFTQANVEPTMFHGVEEACKAETKSSGGSDNASVGSKTAGSATCSMGDALWIAFHCISKLAKSADTCLDGCFAPSLAVFQHYLKRFPGCDPIVQFTLEGYVCLADVAIPADSGNALLRQALLASLCKLSLPSWGKHDPACQLENHHVESLLCLLKILHKHFDNILSDWRMVLWTFQELSVLSISSATLSDEGYTKALAVSSTFSRIAPLTTCLSAESLSCVIDALADVTISCLENDDILTETDAISRVAEVARPRRDSADMKQQHRRVSTSSSIGGDSVDTKPKDSMTGRLMGFAGRTLLGSQTPEVSEHKASVPLPVAEERTRSTYFDSYRREFLQRLLSSKRAIRSDSMGKLPFSLAALTDVSLANIYRYQVCGTSISNHFCSIAVASPDMRDYSMDILAMLIASQLTDEAPIPSNYSGPGRIAIERPLKNQFLTVEVVDKSNVQKHEDDTKATHDEPLSQADLIAPLCTTIRTAPSSELAEAGISAMLSILEGAGHNMTDDVWNVLIFAIASLSGDISKTENDKIDRSGGDWATCCMLAFRCLKLIVDDFLDQLPPMSDSPTAPRRALLDCCSSFGSSRHDLNISLTAIGLLWHIADLDSHSWSIDRALSELVVLSSDDRTEVRNCAVNTLFSCIVGRGEVFTSEQWDVCISQTIFGVYDLVTSKGNSGETESNGDAEVKKSKSASDRYRVSVHHSRDSAGKQWATTQVLVLQGLSRVLRNFFPQLLETMDNTPSDDVGDLSHDPVWFKKAWTRILDVALDAARQPSSRENLDLRTVGVNLLVQCCQFTCRAGMQAAIAPAVVGTNMEVVNGALRHVDEGPSRNNEEAQNLSSAEVEQWRECFFLAAFDALEEYRGHFESDVLNDSEVVNSHYLEATQVQVLHKLTLGLAKLYEGCKDNEFAPWQAPDFQQHNLELNSSFDITSENLEGRFVHLVASIAKTAKGDPAAQFLTQAQRAALELLRLMSNQSSDEAMRKLAIMGGHSFFWVAKKDADDDMTIDASVEGALGFDLLSREAARAVTEELSSGTILDETKVQVLFRILSTFTSEMKSKEAVTRRTHEKKSYALLVPIIEAGLESASKLAGAEDASWLDPLWNSVITVLTHLLTPVQTASNGCYMARSSSLLDILKSVVSYVPSGGPHNVFDILSFGVSSSIDVARGQKVIASDESMTTEVRRKAKTRTEEALKVFEACFDGMCKLEPQSPILHELCRNILEEALSGDEAVAVIVCQVISRNTGMERLAIGIFSILSRLISVDNEMLRIEAGNILGRVDVGQVLEEATRRCETAEERAQEAEEHIQELMDEIEDLREENQSLHQQILVYSTSSALT